MRGKNSKFAKRMAQLQTVWSQHVSYFITRKVVARLKHVGLSLIGLSLILSNILRFGGHWTSDEKWVN